VAKDSRVALGGDPRVLPAQLVALHLPEKARVTIRRSRSSSAKWRSSAVGIAAGSRRDLYEAFKRESESQLLVKVTSAMALDARRQSN
jgi:F-type H+-transporting ATPase subunit delta